MRRRLFVSLCIALAVVVVDQATKYAVRMTILPHESIRVFPALELVNIRNQGAAFGMFSGFGNLFFIVISLAAICFMIWIIVSGREDHRLFALLAGGAAGNLIDRLTLGQVVDFIYVGVAGYHWPAFNVADSALTVGMALMAWKLLRGRP